MIFLYSTMIKNKLKNNKNSYNYYHNVGLKKILPLIKKYADTINEKFIDDLLKHTDIEIMFYLNNSIFSINNIIGIIIYTKTINYHTKQEYIYMLLLCIDKNYRMFGYGKIFLDEFIEYIQNSSKRNKNVILHPLDSCINFYKTYGFKEIESKSYIYKKLFKYEKYNKNKLILILNL